jgi:pimeloyl-ACP methyl ester carboxylesterase
VIDAVRAARAVDRHVSKRWLALGVSEGGQAAWAANELADEYGDGLQFLGSVSLSPAADLSGLARLAAAGWLSSVQQAVFPLMIYGVSVSHPEVVPKDYLHGALAQNTDMWLACAGPLLTKRLQVAATLSGRDTVPSSDAATQRLANALDQLAVPRRKASGPMLVITGDADDMVRPPWVRKAVRRACALGDTVDFIVRPGETHNNLNAGPTYSAWISDRLAGRSAPSTC